jgi:predicted nucleic acid-binding Zn ribbon protein
MNGEPSNDGESSNGSSDPKLSPEPTASSPAPCGQLDEHEQPATGQSPLTTDQGLFEEEIIEVSAESGLLLAADSEEVVDQGGLIDGGLIEGPTIDGLTVENGDAANAPNGGDLASGALESARQMISGQPGSGAARPRVRRRIRRRGDAVYSGARSDDRDPVRIGSVVSATSSNLGWTEPLARARVLGQWPEIVGAEIAAHCEPVSLVDTQLRVTAESTAWATQLRMMAPQILARVTADLPPGIVTRIVFSGPTGPSWRRGPWSMSGGRGVRDTYG